MFASFKPFIAYWHELRGNEILPSREAFHPAKVISFMGRIASWNATTAPISPPALLEQRLSPVWGTNIRARISLR
ncbi:PAS domain-containing protein [Kordiimonas gwangyangensis]|uniref:PAS domain-containing protein n=1 Tax=Kordiimonas gwangyangensis TaxID=288022 RepID=UPI0012DFE1C8